MHRETTNLNTFRRPALLFLAATILFACQDSAAPGDGTPPGLPPVASMQVDLSFFADPNSAPTAASGMVGLNWTNAALRVGLANAAVSIVLAVPVATWAAAGSQTPTVSSGKWHWRFNAQEGGNTFGSHVTGYLDGNESVWEMRITASGIGLDEYLWYEGRARLDGESGYWSFHDAATPSSSVVGRIEWTHPAADAWTLRFSDTNSASPNQGDWLHYEAIGNTRSVSFFDASASAITIEIGWDASTHAGWLIAPGFNNGQRACWDAALNDTSCP